MKRLWLRQRGKDYPQEKLLKKVAKKPAADEAPKAGDEEKTASAEKTAEAGDSSKGKAEG